MSQRRSVNPKSRVVSEEPTVVVKGSLSLETSPNDPEKVPLSNSSSEMSQEGTSLRVKNWKESPFAVGLTEPTWEAERLRLTKRKGEDPNPTLRFDEDFVPRDTTGCLCFSAFVCSYLGAGRVGNMAVLRSSAEWVEEVEQDEETGEEKVTRFTRPRLHCVVGPFWPMLLFVTYPIIFAVTYWAFTNAILPGKKHPLLVLGWCILTFGLIAALALTGCRDPGILYRHAQPPPQVSFEEIWFIVGSSSNTYALVISFTQIAETAFLLCTERK